MFLTIMFLIKMLLQLCFLEKCFLYILVLKNGSDSDSEMRGETCASNCRGNYERASVLVCDNACWYQMIGRQRTWCSKAKSQDGWPKISILNGFKISFSVCPQEKTTSTVIWQVKKSNRFRAYQVRWKIFSLKSLFCLAPHYSHFLEMENSEPRKKLRRVFMADDDEEEDVSWIACDECNAWYHLYCTIVKIKILLLLVNTVINFYLYFLFC